MYHILEPRERYTLSYTIPTQIDESGQPLVGRCTIRIWDIEGQVVAVCTDDPTCQVYPGNYSERIANLVWERAGRPARFQYIEQSVLGLVPLQVVPFHQHGDRLLDANRRYALPTDTTMHRVLTDDYLTF